MKLILAFTVTVICLTTSFSQTNETTFVPKNYLGELDGQHFYYTGLSHVRTNKIILYQIEDENVVQKETIILQYDRFEQIFLFEGKLYGLLSDLEEKTYSLVRFDKFFKEEKRTEIMPYKDKPQNLGQKVFSQPVNQLTKIIIPDEHVSSSDRKSDLLFRICFVRIRPQEVFKKQNYNY